MKILVVLVSDKKKACAVFAKEKGILNRLWMPKDMQEMVDLSAMTFSPAVSGQSVETFLHSELDKWDSIVLMVDGPLVHQVAQLGNAFFIGQLDLPDYAGNYQNVLAGAAKRLLKNFGFLLIAMKNSERAQAVSLPLRNFQAPELTDLAHICRTRTLEPEFNNEIMPNIASLVGRRGPKRRSEYPNLYFRDDYDKHFEYGKEDHCKPATGTPHLITCEIHVKYRFGRRIDCDHHFNVTQGPKDKSTISGEFLDCHGATIDVKRKTHINMFSSDFHD